MNTRKAKRTNDSLTKAVARRLKELRSRCGFSQEYVNENTGLNLPRIESGITNISIVTLDELCRFYKTPLREFFEPFDK